MRIAVTGASGFVGGALCRALAERGVETLAFGRRDASAVPPGHLAGAAYRAWDITAGPLPDPPRADAVVHCAGGVTDWGPAAPIFAANLAGTVHALASFPGARFVHLSTASVYDPLRPTVMAAESEAPVARYPNAYGASKAAAERAVLAAMADRDAIVLRPHAVYGPGDTTLLPRVLSAVRGPLLPAVGSGRTRVSLTSVANLVRACLLAASGPVRSGVFNVTDAAPVTLDAAFRAILAERGVRARPVYVPARAAMPLAAAAEGAFLLARSRRPPRLTRYAAGHLAVERTLDITAARAVLGYEPDATSFAGAAAW
ncbi:MULTISPECIES: NAD-dependent epimerase/dehydratase family protein [Actinomadura]|uniref:NAD-dependent epimerase/dehydratase family protein n=1 Tax=Actinomadura yumaensis TaxID=111807 RepID=A0ABW2CB52_9ACTN|nr:NAD-dependent epimerase/dehydratase family protein [Actinomadura sp. J1-007]MWK33586.1 NAD-dependent epimerase/dehydratase family protein [Actinomadura sp. J1-007]